MLNKEEFDYLGISKWHELGIKGEGITIATRERMTEHGSNVYDIIKQVCPEANIRIDVEYDEDEDYDIYTTSLFFSTDKRDEKKERIKELSEKGKLVFCASGNSGKGKCSFGAKSDMLSVGACKLLNGKPRLEEYSSKCEHLDFVSFSHLYTSYSLVRPIDGTSFSSPLLAGMVALVQCYFLKIRSKKLSYDEMLEYMKLNCIDLGEKGRDDNYGYGLFILPEIEVNMFNDYTEYEKAIEYLADKKEMDNPDLWKDRIKRDNDINLMWFCIKWANAVARN